MSLPEIIRRFTSRAGVIRVQNALNGILWGCAVASPICFSFAAILGYDPILRYGFAAIGALPVLTLVSAYLYFMLKDPDRLQSEEFIERQQELTLLERMGQPPIIPDRSISEELQPGTGEGEER